MNEQNRILELYFGFPFPKASIYAFSTSIFIGLLLCYKAYDRISEYDIKGLETLDYLNSQSIWIGGLLIIISSILVLLVSEGIIIDFQNKKYKSYFRVLGFRFGKWRYFYSDFYIITYQCEYNYSYSYAGNITGQLTSGATGRYLVRDSYFEAYIYDKDGENRILISKGSKNKVIKQANEVSNRFNCELIVND